MNSSISILFVDDDLQVLRSSAEWLSSFGHSVRRAHNTEVTIRTLRENIIDLAFVDLRLGSENGMDILLFIKENYPHIPVVILSGLATIDDVICAFHHGAIDFLTKPLLDNKVLEIIEKVRTLKQDSKQQAVPKPVSQTTKKRSENIPEKSAFHGIVGQSVAMSELHNIVERIADTRATVLITGESGTGKSLLARAIHSESSRRDAPFVEVAAGALPDSLLESELFGHEIGAFTGAVAKKVGRFLQADGGTIFLDEIGTASIALQIKLLRVLQDFEFEAVGGTKTHRVDTRVILATNENLEQAVLEGRFRQDLFYRINVINLELPPLRQRIDDIMPLAEFFLKKTIAECPRNLLGFMPETADILVRYSWPGNVRELQNVIERAVFLGRFDWITPDDLPIAMRGNTANNQQPERVGYSELTHQSSCAEQMYFSASDLLLENETDEIQSFPGLKRSLSLPERQIILDALEANHWRRSQTANALGINRTTLYKKMKKFGLCVSTNLEPELVEIG